VPTLGGVIACPLGRFPFLNFRDQHADAEAFGTNLLAFFTIVSSPTQRVIVGGTTTVFPFRFFRVSFSTLYPAN